MGLKIRHYLLSFFFLFPLSAFSQEKDSVVEVMLSNSMQWNEEDSTLQINEMSYPFFDTNAAQLYYYIEVTPIHDTSKAFVFVELKKKSNMQFKLKAEYTKRLNLADFLDHRMLDSIPLRLVNLPSGNYDFIVNLMGDSTKVIHQKKASFQSLAPANNLKRRSEELDATLNTNTTVDFDKTFVAKYDIATLKKNIPTLEAKARGGEIKVIKEIVKNNDLNFLRQFFYNFWYNRNPSNPEAAWKAYADQLNHVGKLYGSSSTPGYQSDRGKIYLMFGEPDIKERVVNEKGARPYEVWFYYNAEGRPNAKFLFCQTGLITSQMFLIHSSEEDIVINPSWRVVLLDNPNDKDSRLMHRVFEFFK
jgi:GWxTD domain-containing protein